MRVLAFAARSHYPRQFARGGANRSASCKSSLARAYMRPRKRMRVVKAGGRVPGIKSRDLRPKKRIIYTKIHYLIRACSGPDIGRHHRVVLAKMFSQVHLNRIVSIFTGVLQEVGASRCSARNVVDEPILASLLKEFCS